MYYIVVINYGNGNREALCKGNEFSKYLEPRRFATKKDAKRWVERHSYPYMSFSYEIERRTK